MEKPRNPTYSLLVSQIAATKSYLVELKRIQEEYYYTSTSKRETSSPNSIHERKNSSSVASPPLPPPPPKIYFNKSELTSRHSSEKNVFILKIRKFGIQTNYLLDLSDDENIFCFGHEEDGQVIYFANISCLPQLIMKENNQKVIFIQPNFK